MALANTFVFTHTVVDGEKFLEATHNQYKVVSVRPYVDKKGELPEGLNLTLMVMKDDYNYGVDKKGVPRENNELHNFDVTVLNRTKPIKKGDMVRLLGFDAEHSYAIGFDLLMRFKDYEVLQPKARA